MLRQPSHRDRTQSVIGSERIARSAMSWWVGPLVLAASASLVGCSEPADSTSPSRSDDLETLVDAVIGDHPGGFPWEGASPLLGRRAIDVRDERGGNDVPHLSFAESFAGGRMVVRSGASDVEPIEEFEIQIYSLEGGVRDAVRCRLRAVFGEGWERTEGQQRFSCFTDRSLERVMCLWEDVTTVQIAVMPVEALGR